MTTKKPLPADYGDATPEQVTKAVGRFKRDQDEQMSKFNRVIGDDGAPYLYPVIDPAS